ncbi:hypothetical protein [Streptomyces sp. KL116D]|uniref:hypothetical protein n=1 Tax=Streptomyces sp. KL116D TaxID=3045152 RepID=UPI003557F2E3
MTHVVTTVLRGMLRAVPGERDRLRTLRDVLVAGAVPTRRARSVPRWGSPPGRPAGPAVGAAHGAGRVALDRTARVLGEESDAARAAREGGVRWLLACPDPAQTTAAWTWRTCGRRCAAPARGRTRPRGGPERPPLHGQLADPRAADARRAEVAHTADAERVWRELLAGAATRRVARPDGSAHGPGSGTTRAGRGGRYG